MKRTLRLGEPNIAGSLALLFIVMLSVASFIIMMPFLAPLLWGVILAIAMWPAFSRLRRLLGNRRTLAAILMTLLLAVVLLGPVAVIATVITEEVATLGGRLRAAVEDGLAPPDFLMRIPYIGPRLVERWLQLVADGHLTEGERDLIGAGLKWILGLAATLVGGIAQLALSIVCAFFFFRDGEAALMRLSDVVSHIAGERSRHLLSVTHGTLKGVVYGVLGAVLAQATLASIGYVIVGVPAPFLLGLLTGFLGIVPGGPALVFLPVAIWLFRADELVLAGFITLWGVLVVSNIDNVMKALFVSRGSSMPLLLVLFGILGGAMAFGFIGIFLGPTILAILYALILEWSPGEAVPPPATGGTPPASP
ncbi:MAG: AI-2E family transporter [Rhodospirillales bacterium]|nr:MAG: AI-2E family transporter [Rhodospirillales bacterium]